MAFDLAVPLKLLKQPLHDSIDELRQGYQSLSECVEQAVAECEQRGAELADCRRQLAEARRSLMEQEKALAERDQALAEATRRAAATSKQLEAGHADLAQANEKLMRLQGEEMQSRQRLEVQIEHNQQLQARIVQLESADADSRTELTQLRHQMAPLTESTVEAARLRGELVAAQAELTSLRGQLAAQSERPDLSQQLAEALDERQQAERELDLLRRRAAELAEALGEQKRVMAEEREQWSEELRLLRRAVDRQSEILVHRPAHSAAAHPAAVAPAASEPRTAEPVHHDQVMDTVVQQFEMLQKNKVRKMAKSAR